jgi:hypothetical protein
MTEQEWLECTDPQKMLELLRGKTSDRKLRLFAVACCRHVWRLVPADDDGKIAVMVSERFADRLATREELKAARRRARSCEVVAARLDAFQAAEETANTAAYKVRLLALDYQCKDPILAGYTTWTTAGVRLEEQETREQCALLRDIFGKPFRHVTIPPAVVAWNDGTVQKIAQAIYDERAFDRMPILADALEESGCTNTDILNHCRLPGEHVRGCWVVDLILGKE